MLQENNNGESKIRKVIFNEVTLVIALVSMISGVIFWVTNPQYEMELKIVKLETQMESNQTIVKELEKIKNNDFVEIHKAIEQVESRQIEILQSLAAISQELKMHDRQ